MFPPMVRNTCIRFAPLERGGIFWVRFSINISFPYGTRNFSVDIIQQLLKVHRWDGGSGTHPSQHSAAHAAGYLEVHRGL